jgi:PASTA domain
MQTITVQGNPNSLQANKLAVQNAVNQGGMVILEGIFQFDDANPNATPPDPPMGSAFSRVVTITKDVIIVGDIVGNQMPTIQGGHIPFRVEAPDCSVMFLGLRFESPKCHAISVCSVKGLLVANCQIVGVVPELPDGKTAFEEDGVTAVDKTAVGVFVDSEPQRKKPMPPYPPSTISGPLTIIDNEIDTDVGFVVDGSVDTVGIHIFRAGAVGEEVDIRLSGNKIRNVLTRAINLRHIGGRALVALNEIETGSVSVDPDGNKPDVIHAFGSGSYLIAHNSIVCEWKSAAGIRVHSRTNFEEPIADASITENDVAMRPPADVVFGADTPNSAGIAISGFAKDIKVTNNRITGRARAAVAVEAEGDAAPENTQVVLNPAAFPQLPPVILHRLGKVLVGGQPPQPTDTLLVVRQKDAEFVEDHGLRTQIVTVSVDDPVVHPPPTPVVPKTTVPPVVGLTKKEAASEVQLAGLVPTFTGNQGSQSLVVKQDPEAEQVVAKGSPVKMSLRRVHLPI